jgi:hypothetical protein
MEVKYPWDAPHTRKRGAARYLGCSVSSVERYMRDGGLRFIRYTPNGAAHFRYSDLADFVEKRLHQKETGPCGPEREAASRVNACGGSAEV